MRSADALSGNSNNIAKPNFIIAFIFRLLARMGR
jgi:hypothetical protein